MKILFFGQVKLHFAAQAFDEPPEKQDFQDRSLP